MITSTDESSNHRPFILAGLIIVLIGFTIQISDAHRNVKYFGTFLCVGGGYAAFPSIVAWLVCTSRPSPILNYSLNTHRLGNNLSGQYKRGVGMALQIGIGNFSGSIYKVDVQRRMSDINSFTLHRCNRFQHLQNSRWASLHPWTYVSFTLLTSILTTNLLNLQTDSSSCSWGLA